MNLERASWLIFGIVAFAIMGSILTIQQNTIRTILHTQAAMLEDYDTLTRDVQKLRRELEDEKRIHETLLRQMDLIVAASRSGWDAAHRLIAAGVLGIEAQGSAQ